MNLRKDNVYTYIHCRSGHGRSGLVVACILKVYHSWDTDTALMKTNEYHNMRKDMKPQWRRIGAPQTTGQKDYVRQFV